MRMMKVKMPDNGFVVTLNVDESKTVQQLMEDISPQLKITNNHNFSLARDKEPRGAGRSFRLKVKDKKETRRSVEAGGTVWLLAVYKHTELLIVSFREVIWLDENQTLREQNVMESELLLLMTKKVINDVSGW